MEEQNLNKIEINPANEQIKPSLEFKEPEWMRILKRILEQRELAKTIKTPND